MTEEQAKAAILELCGEHAFSLIEQFLLMVAEENSQQNLIAASTLPTIWSRHAYDSVQLLRYAGEREGAWIDIGSGGGFPGMLVGIARRQSTLLVEPRRKRAEFLERAVTTLGIGDRVSVAQQRIERVTQRGAILSARAVAAIEVLFDMAHHCSRPETRWLLPRGHIAPEEISGLRQRWAFMFHVEHSEVSGESSIAIFDEVKRR